MSEKVKIEISDKWGRWFYEDRFDIRTPVPLLAQTEDGQTFEVITVDLTSVWASGSWNLAEVDLSGTVLNDDGTYGGDAEREFFDFTATDENERVPDWVLRLASKRAALIPTPPETGKEETA